VNSFSFWAAWQRRKNKRRPARSQRGVRLEIEQLESRTLMTANLVAAYNFDEGSGTVLHDISGNGNNGTITNATWSTAGKYSGALKFTGASNSYVTVNDASSLHLSTGMTLEAWVDPSTLNSQAQGWVAAISKEHRASTSNDVSYALYAAGGIGTPPTAQLLLGNTDQGPQGTSALQLNNWSFLAATYDGAALRLYVNGTQVASQSLSGSIVNTTDPLRIGGDWSSEMFTGLIDNVRIYNGALTQTQITSDMNTAVSAPAATQFADDSSSQGFTATGPWTSYAGVGYLGNMHYIAPGSGANSAKWTFAVTPGQYDVAVTYSWLDNHATNAPYTVLDGTTSLGTFKVNQQLAPSGISDQGVNWVDLGTFNVSSSQLVVQLSDNANGYIIADGVRIQKLGNLPTVQVQDGATPIATGSAESFGSTYVGSPVTKTITVKNNGTQTLTLGAIGTMPQGFSLVQGFGSSSLAAGASTTFQVSLSASAAGSYSGTLSFTTSDTNFPTYSFTLSGTVQIPVQILDDSSQGFTTVGSWTGYTGVGYQGNMHFIAPGSGANLASWTFAVTPGQYDVAVTYSWLSNHATNAPYSVFDGTTSLGTVQVNQQVVPSGLSDQGVNWTDLGTFNVNSTQLVVQLSANANGYVIADGVRIQKVGNVPTVQVQDGNTSVLSGGADSFGTTNLGTAVTRTITVKNTGAQALTLGAIGSLPQGFALIQSFASTSLAPGASTTFQVSLTGNAVGTYSGTLSFATNDTNFPTYSFTVSGTVQMPVQLLDDSSSQGFTATGPWTSYTGVGYLGNMHYIAPGSGANSAKWTFAVTPGQYDVAVTYSWLENHATNAPYTVLDGTTSLGTFKVNQQLAPSGISDQGINWVDLGTFNVSSSQLVVQLSDNANGYVIADGVRIQKAAASGLSVGPASLPTATANSAYTATISATGGSGSYAFAVSSGNLPAGLTLSGRTGVLSGTPTASGSFSFTITATDANNSSLSGSTAYNLTVNSASAAPAFPNNSNPPALPTPSGTVMNVSTVAQLQSAVANLQSGQTIMIAAGTYNLTGTLYVPQNLTNIAIRGATGNASDVVIKGDAVINASAPYSGSAIWGSGSGISGSIQFGIWLGNVQGVTIGDLTLENYVDDAIILNAGVQSPLIHNVVMLDTGEQLLKSNPNGSGGGVNNGVVEYCTIGYTTAAPNNYTNGIDIHTGQNWSIRNNVFKNILTTNTITTTGPGALAGPAVLIWNGSSNCTTVANTFINCQREIAYGLSDPTIITDDNSGGLIANNFIFRSDTQHGDVSIGVWNSPNTEVAYNTVILNGDYINAVEYRFSTTTGVKLLYNLTDAAITSRDSANGTVTGNVTNAQSSWFVNESIGNLNLTSAATAAIGHGVYLSEVPTDYGGQTRPSVGPTDVGAAQYTASTSASSLTMSPATLSSATANSAYSATLSATGGSSSYTFAVTSGSLPAWLTLNAGLLSGTPTTTGSSSFTITATDSKNASLKGSQAYTLAVNPASSLAVSPPTIPSATANSAYSATLSATGGSGNYTFAVTSGSLPAGLSLNGSSGVLSGTPTASGSSTFTITATDSGSSSLKGSQAYAFTVNAPGTSQPLLYSPNVQYVGAFRVPNGQFGSDQYDTFSYGGTALAYNAANNSLFMVGHPYEQAIAQISIPSTIVNSSNVSSLTTASMLQNFDKVLNSIPNNTLSGYPNPNAVGGLAVVNGKLLGSVYNTYDANGTAPDAHFIVSSLNLATASVSGYYQVGNVGGGLTSGYMTPVPTAWQSAFGAPYLTGQADINIISRTSSGPAVFGFDPSAVGTSMAPVTPYLYYPVNTPLGAYSGAANPLQSGTTQVNGVVFVPGSSSVLFFGTTGTNYNGYGEAADYGDTNHTSKGPHSLNGQYAFQVWAYNANDLVAVKNGTVQPWQVKPYAVWNFNLPSATAGDQIGGVAFDPSTDRIYVSVLDADNVAAYSNLPLIEVFQVNTSALTGAQKPQIGTLAVTTTAAAPSGSTSPLAPGPIAAGTPVLLTAGNVYDINGNGSSVVGVKFYLDTDGDGTFNASTDTLLGSGTASGNNWTLTMSTTGLSSGTHIIYAQALDSNGLFSDPIAITLTIQ
jgi:hypothetical protein